MSELSGKILLRGDLFQAHWSTNHRQSIFLDTLPGDKKVVSATKRFICSGSKTDNEI